MKPRTRDFARAPFQAAVQAQFRKRQSDMRYPAGLGPVSTLGFIGFDARKRKAPPQGGA